MRVIVIVVVAFRYVFAAYKVYICIHIWKYKYNCKSPTHHGDKGSTCRVQTDSVSFNGHSVAVRVSLFILSQ